MKKLIALFVAIVLIVAAFLVYKYSGQKTTSYNNQPQNNINTTTPMNITSTAFMDNQAIPKQYTCDGDGINPPLFFSNIPAQAKTLALLIEDPDAPNGTWYHWLMWNIPAATNQIAENSVPQGAIQGQVSSGQNVYGAPCPPSGTHHYIFTLYALDSSLAIPSYSTVDNFKTAIGGHVVEQAQLVGIYGR